MVNVEEASTLGKFFLILASEYRLMHVVFAAKMYMTKPMCPNT
jgi:hypothetical protein